jgi:uncharacterized damage-inducible protein DinB
MSTNTHLIAELKQEAANTRKMLERVPMDKLSWKPHEKSYTLGQLSKHIAELPGWVSYTMDQEELNLAGEFKREPMPTTNEELLAIHDKNFEKAMASLEKSKDEDFGRPWSLKNGEHSIFTMPKAGVLRSMTYSHFIHHRGQLSVYLRLLDVPLPGMYGPTADDRMGM